MANPFNRAAGVVDVGNFAAPEFVDIDADGDADAVIGSSHGTISFYENIGTASQPTFYSKTGSNNPFDTIDVGDNSAPACFDADADGDFDVVIGNSIGEIRFWRNTGTPSQPVYLEEVGSGNPFVGLNVSSKAAPECFDVDGDGLPDCELP